ncbi:hypothetical protein CMO93_05660 [Candidatus Woesearchaeota archaeon]|nr:hypothetical protein [Candidatus Woesearchaeota archaeon]|tara:strand:- start:41 stop:526 length:486 start_codon:yes stop_codon:yes gene_type:complete
MNKKSQAALEFLTTYAWAFIAILITIAAITYFGVLNPQKIFPDRCTFNVGFGCDAFVIVDDGADTDKFNLRLKNQLGEVIDVTAFTLKEEDGTTLSCGAQAPITSWNIGEIKDLAWTDCTFPSSVVSGTKYKMQVEIDFFNSNAGSTYTRTAAGEVFSTVQ